MCTVGRGFRGEVEVWMSKATASLEPGAEITMW